MGLEQQAYEIRHLLLRSLIFGAVTIRRRNHLFMLQSHCYPVTENERICNTMSAKHSSIHKVITTIVVLNGIIDSIGDPRSISNV
jgi:hypothetical protein